MATLRASWRARCRWHLRRHRYVKVIDKIDLDSMGFDWYTGRGPSPIFNVRESHRACAWCNKREPHRENI